MKLFNNYLNDGIIGGSRGVVNLESKMVNYFIKIYSNKFWMRK